MEEFYSQTLQNQQGPQLSETLFFKAVELEAVKFKPAHLTLSCLDSGSCDQCCLQSVWGPEDWQPGIMALAWVHALLARLIASLDLPGRWAQEHGAKPTGRARYPHSLILGPFNPQSPPPSQSHHCPELTFSSTPGGFEFSLLPMPLLFHTGCFQTSQVVTGRWEGREAGHEYSEVDNQPLKNGEPTPGTRGPAQSVPLSLI